MPETSVPPPDDDLPANASGHVAEWPYRHTIAELDRCWDAYMEATVSPGVLNGTFFELALYGVRPGHLSHIFDLVLTVGDQLLDEVPLSDERLDDYRW